MNIREPLLLLLLKIKARNQGKHPRNRKNAQIHAKLGAYTEEGARRRELLLLLLLETKRKKSGTYTEEVYIYVGRWCGMKIYVRVFKIYD